MQIAYRNIGAITYTHKGAWNYREIRDEYDS